MERGVEEVGVASVVGDGAEQSRGEAPLRHRPKVEAATERLAEMAREAGPGGKLPRVSELRSLMGVSLGTLDAALGEAEALGLVRRRHGSGIWASPRLRARACLVCEPSFFTSSNASPFWPLLVERAHERAERLALHRPSDSPIEFSLHFCAALDAQGSGPSSAEGTEDRTEDRTEESGLQKALAEEVRSGMVGGMLGVGLSERTARWLEERGVPLVSFAGPGSHIVGIDTASIVREGARALARAGCRRLGLWASVASGRPVQRFSPDLMEVADAFRHEVLSLGLDHDPSLVQLNQDEIDPATGLAASCATRQGLSTARRVFGTGAAAVPDGVVITDDMLTSGALTGLSKLGVAVGTGPGQLKVATHSNRASPVLLGREGDLWRLEVDPSVLADALFDALELLMAGREAPRLALIAPRVLAPGES